VLDEDGAIRSGLPCAAVRNLFLGRRLVSFPYSDYCDPLIREPEDYKRLVDSVKRQADEEGTQEVELRTYKTAQGVCESNGARIYSNFVLSIDRSPKDLFSEFHKSCVQRAIRKAERSDLRVAQGETLDDMRDFYRLHVLTRKRQGVPVQPFRFLKNLWTELFSRGQISLLLAQNAERVVAALVLLKFKDTVYYKFGASDRSFRHLRANQLLFWRAIQLAAQSDFKLFDFGRTALSNAGLQEFKKRWGTSAEPISYLSILSSEKSLQTMPDGNFVQIAQKILRVMPAPLTRLSGELFYRYLA